jgi:hypothetical protein
MKLFFALFLVPVVLIVVLTANELAGNTEVVGEPYTVSFTYCGGYAGIGGTRHCNLWLTGTERRVNTLIHGLFFDISSIKVVDR